MAPRVLSAEYYLDENILKAGPNKLLIQVLSLEFKLVIGSVLWRVCTGSKVNIWNDSWIPSSPNRMVISPRGIFMMSKVRR